MKTWIATLIAVLLVATAQFASAGQLASLSVISQSTGERLQIWRHNGRNYVAGNPGERYAVEVRNQTGGRLLSVVSVDGVNVVNGATASTNQAGYVLDPWQPMEVKGWRKSMDEVAAFYFTRLSDSYAARTDRPDNVGVIGVALFREYQEPEPVRELAQDRAMAPAAPAAQASGSMAKRAYGESDSKIGTGHGERIASSTRMTDFRRASSAANEIISIQYDTYERLVARGIIPRNRAPSHDPMPFPGSFAPDPRY